MAKESLKARQRKRKKIIKRFAAKRKRLKEELDYIGLQMLPRKASPTGLCNLCELTGKKRGYLRRFGISRNEFRRLALLGLIPGVTKSSW